MKKCLSLLILCGCFSYAFAQSNIKSTTKPYKPPKLITSLAQYHDTLQKLTRDQALALITSPLQINDEKKGVYTISSYQFIYKKSVKRQITTITKINSTGIKNGSSRPRTCVLLNICSNAFPSKLWHHCSNSLIYFNFQPLFLKDLAKSLEAQSPRGNRKAGACDVQVITPMRM